MVTMVVIPIVVVCAGLIVWWWLRRSGDVSRDADRFAVARAMTTRWAEDPTSAPAPVRDLAAELRQPPPDQETETTDVSGARPS